MMWPPPNRDGKIAKRGQSVFWYHSESSTLPPAGAAKAEVTGRALASA